MTKRDSVIIKGIAILMMLFLHLFNEQLMEFHPELDHMPYEPLCYIGSHPIEYIMTRFCRPVPFFFILSGYGISVMHTQGKLSFQGQLIRLLNIFIAYWITLLIFVSLGHWLEYKNYPGSIWNLIANISAYSNSYNLSMWFLFPYTLICLSSSYIIKMIEHKKAYVSTLIISGLLYGITGYIIKYHINTIRYESILGHLLQYIEYYFPFICGIVMHKSSILYHTKLNILDKHKLLTLILLIIIVLLKSTIDSQSIDTLYALAFIILFTKLKLPSHLNNTLFFIGKYSMVMWMVHMYLSHYFFTDFFYSFHSSLLIFANLTLVSLAISIIITKISHSIFIKLTETK